MKREIHSVRWQLYAWLYVAVLIYAHGSLISAGATTLDVLDIAWSAGAAIGVLGFAYQRPVFSRQFWQLFFVAFIAWDLLYEVVLCAWLGLGQGGRLSVPGPGLVVAALAVAVVSFFLPAYVALFKYAYRPNHAWQAPRAA